MSGRITVEKLLVQYKCNFNCSKLIEQSSRNKSQKAVIDCFQMNKNHHVKCQIKLTQILRIVRHNGFILKLMK